MVAVLDANVLYPASLRDFFMHLAIADATQIRWSTKIEAEWTHNLIANRPDLEPSRVYRTAARMNAALPDAMVADASHLEAHLILPDPDDRHVLATAIACKADGIVTKNLADFPPSTLGVYQIQVWHPDAFVVHLLESQSSRILQALFQQQQSLKSPQQTLTELLDTLTTQGLVKAVSLLRPLI